MRTGNLLFSAVHFFVVFFIFSLGIFFVALPYADYFRIQLVNFLLDPGKICFLIGGIILGMGALLFTIAYLLNRKTFVRMKMGGALVDIEEGVIRKCALTYFQEKFPNCEPLSDVVIYGKSTIEIITSLPKPQEEEFFIEVEEELTVLLARKLGYQKAFRISFVET